MKHILNRYPAAEVVQALTPIILDRRKQRIEKALSHRIDNIQIAIENPYDPRNAAAILRTAEALGLTTLHVVANNSRALLSKGVTQGAYHWLEVHKYEQTLPFIQSMQQQGVITAGACVDGELGLHELPIEKPICILLGNEHEGLSETAKSHCDLQFQIPMFGMSESFNVSVSAAISLYDLLTRYRKTTQSDLSTERQIHLRAIYYMKSVDNRLLETLFK